MQQTKSHVPKILLLSSAEIEENEAKNDAFVANLNERLQDDCIVEWSNYHDIGLEIAGGSLEAFRISDGQPLDNFRVVYFKSYFRYQELASAIAEALAACHVQFVGAELKHYIPATKLTQLARLSRGGLHVPLTLYMSIEHYVNHYDLLKEKLGDKFIFKAIDGSTGEDNYLITSQAQLAEIVAGNVGRHFIAQEFIANDSDLRLLVVGGEVRLVIERRRHDDSTHLNNTSQGAAASLVSLEKIDPKLHRMALKAADIMNREIAGVDIVLEKDSRKPFLLEVNASPQIASGAYVPEKLQLYADYFKGLVT